ncbi:MAG TPA: hypothetical protein VK694_01005 [Verrucomicrobiae bacterium]|nr:hypothetical protein [Verrucomicrobiae bacterium]
MSNEERAPEGYGLQKCGNLGVATFMPEEWHYWHQDLSVLIGHERIAVGSVDDFLAGVPLNEGYITGLSVAGCMGEPGMLQEIAERHIENPVEALVPASGIQSLESGPLVTRNRTFEHKGGSIMGVQKDAMTFYCASIIQRGTDKLYTATFETLTEYWDTFREVGKIMVEGFRVSDL